MRTKKHVMKLLCLLAPMCLLCQPADAVTGEDLLQRFLLLTPESTAGQHWSMVGVIPGLVWDGPRRKNSFDETLRIGTMKLNGGRGKATVALFGTETLVTRLEIDIPESAGKIFEREDFAEVMKAEFPHARRERTAVCNIGYISGHHLYRLQYPQRSPVFVRIFTDPGGNAPQSRMSGFEVRYEQPASWTASCG